MSFDDFNPSNSSVDSSTQSQTHVGLLCQYKFGREGCPRAVAIRHVPFELQFSSVLFLMKTLGVFSLRSRIPILPSIFSMGIGYSAARAGVGCSCGSIPQSETFPATQELIKDLRNESRGFAEVFAFHSVLFLCLVRTPRTWVSALAQRIGRQAPHLVTKGLWNQKILKLPALPKDPQCSTVLTNVRHFFVQNLFDLDILAVCKIHLSALFRLQLTPGICKQWRNY